MKDRIDHYERTLATYESPEAVETYNRTLQTHRDPILLQCVNAFVDRLPEFAAVVDVGCGTGDIVNHLSELGFRAVGLDYSRTMISLATRTAKGRFAVCDIISPFLLFDEKFDAVICLAVLLHIKPDALAMAIRNICSFGERSSRCLMATKIGGFPRWDLRLGPEYPRATFSHESHDIDTLFSEYGFRKDTETIIDRRINLKRESMYVAEYCAC